MFSQSIADITGTQTPVFVSGKRFFFNPIDFSVIGKIASELQRLEESCLPDIEKAIAAIDTRGAPATVAALGESLLKTHRRMRFSLQQFGVNRLIAYIMDDAGCHFALKLCCDIEKSDTTAETLDEDVFSLLLRSQHDDNISQQLRHWLVASGLVSAVDPGDSEVGESGVSAGELDPAKA